MEPMQQPETGNEIGAWGIEQPVEPPVSVLVRSPHEPTWRSAILLAWRKQLHEPAGPWWGYVSFPDGASDHFRHDWMRLAPNWREAARLAGRSF